MYEAQLLRTGSTVYSPWFARGGDSATFRCEVVRNQNGSITVTMVTKNSNETGPGESADSGVEIVGTTTQIYAATINGNIDGPTDVGFKELVRYKFQVTGDGGYVLFRMLPLVWFDDVDAS